MGVFLVLLWCSAVVERGIAGNSRNSRFGGFNSRLGGQKFPIRHATGIDPQAFDLACLSHDRRPAAAEKSTNSRHNGKNPEWDEAMLFAEAQ